MTRRAVSTPPAAPATSGDGCARTVGSGCGSAGHPLASIAQIHRGPCPQLASLTPLAHGGCKPRRNRAWQQVSLLSSFSWHTKPPSSASSAPRRAAAHAFARRLERLASSGVRDEDGDERHGSNSSGRSACALARPRTWCTGWRTEIWPLRGKRVRLQGGERGPDGGL